MVGGHQLQCLGAEDLRPIQRAAIDQHPAETVIIAERGGKAAAARLEAVLDHPAAFVALVEQLHLVARVIGVAIRDAVLLGRGHLEVRVIHAERLEDAFFQHIAERLALDPLDDCAHNVGGNRIIPDTARIELERDGGHRSDEFFHRARALEIVDLFAAIGGVNRGALLKAIGEAAGMAQQIDHLHGCRCRAGDERHTTAARLKHAGLGELRQNARHWIAQRDLALFHQLHERHRSDRLGHAGDAENRILLQRLTGSRVSLKRKMCNLVTAPDQQGRVRQQAGVDVFRLDIGINAGKPVWQKAEIAGVGNCQHSSTPFVSSPRPVRVERSRDTWPMSRFRSTRTGGILNATSAPAIAA